jgi:transposase InsO family protein
MRERFSKKALHQACPIKISKVLTDNGQEFTDRLFACGEREPSGKHVFDQTCQQLSIEHRLTKPRTPCTNGMVERFNGRIADVLKTHRFNGQEDLAQTLHRYVYLYNYQLPQSALQSKTPVQAIPAVSTGAFGSCADSTPFSVLSWKFVEKQIDRDRPQARRKPQL